MSEALPAFDPTAPEIVADPYPHYARYRAAEPVHVAPTRAPLFPEQWFLFRHADVVAALRDPRLGRDWRRAAPPREVEPDLPEPLRALGELVSSWMLFTDPPRHTALRGAVGAAFRPRALAPLEGWIAERAAQLRRECLERGRFDALADFALPLTSGAIAELLGVPEQERTEFVDAMRGLEPVFGGARSQLPAAALSARRVSALFERAIEAGGPGVLGSFRGSTGAERKQAIATSIFLFGAGFATTLHALGNGLLALLRHPEQIEKLRQQPELRASAVEEILRFDPPIQGSQRFALEPLELAGRRIPKGALVSPLLGAANRDPEAFTQPDDFDIARDARAHVAFGGGIHHCLGAELARLELRVALGVLLPALPRLELAGERLEYRLGAARGLRRLALEVAR